LRNKIAEKLGLSIHERQLLVASQAYLRPVLVRFQTPLDMDLDSLIETLRPFLRWAQENAFKIPCNVELPDELRLYFDRSMNRLCDGASIPADSESRSRFFSEGLQMVSDKISQGIRATAFDMIGIRKNRHAEKDISEVELRIILNNYITSTLANFIFQLMRWGIADQAPPTWLHRFYEVRAGVGDSFCRGLAFVLKNTFDELLFWTNAELYFEDEWRFTKHLYLPSVMLISGHRDSIMREDFIKFIIPQLIHLALSGTNDKFNVATLQTVSTYPERLRVYAQGKWFIELDHFEQLSNSAKEREYLRKMVEATFRDLVERRQFKHIEAMYQSYDETERKDVVFEHVMIALHSLLRA
jgi:hypothetical protein